MSLALECSIASNAEIYHHCLVGLSYWESGKVEIPHYQPHQLAPTDIASTVLNAGTELVRHSSLGAFSLLTGYRLINATLLFILGLSTPLRTA